MKKYSTAIIAVAAMASITSCASATPAASEPALVFPETYSMVTDLRDGFTAAGGECSTFKITNKITHAAESMECGTDTVLSTYLSAEAVQTQIESSKQFLGGSSKGTWLVGENWIVNAPNAVDLQEQMGGQIVSF